MITRAASMSVSVAVAAVTAAVAGANAAPTTTWAELPPPRRTQQPGVISWEYSHHPSACPCANASLCLPIRRVGPEKAFVFHTGYKSDRPVWSLYDWTRESCWSVTSREQIAICWSVISLSANDFDGSDMLTRGRRDHDNLHLWLLDAGAVLPCTLARRASDHGAGLSAGDTMEQHHGSRYVCEISREQSSCKRVGWLGELHMLSMALALDTALNQLHNRPERSFIRCRTLTSRSPTRLPRARAWSIWLRRSRKPFTALCQGVKSHSILTVCLLRAAAIPLRRTTMTWRGFRMLSTFSS
jgi:hypothetical protein